MNQENDEKLERDDEAVDAGVVIGIGLGQDIDESTPRYDVLVAESQDELEELKEEAQIAGAVIVVGTVDRLPGGKRVWTQKIRRRGPEELKRAKDRAAARANGLVKAMAGSASSVSSYSAGDPQANKEAKLAVGYAQILSSELIVRDAKDTSDHGDSNLAGTRHPGAVVELTLSCGHVIKRNASTFRSKLGRIRCSKCAYVNLRNRAVDEGLEIGIVGMPDSVTQMYMSEKAMLRKHERDKARQTMNSNTGGRTLDGMPVILFKDRVNTIVSSSVSASVNAASGNSEPELETEPEPDPDWYNNSWE